MAPTFSVLMASYNYENYVGEAIDSVIAQTFPSWELIVVDDASRDNSWGVLQQYADHPQITMLRHEQQAGVSAAYNTGLARAEGEFITNLDSDDRFRPHLLQRHHDAAEANPDVAIFACHVAAIDEYGVQLDGPVQRADWFNRDWDYNDPAGWVWSNPVCHNGAVIRRTAHEAVGPMSLDHFPAGDWDLWIRFLTGGFRFGVVPEVLVESRVHPRAVTGSANENLVREYALTSARHFHPWLHSIGRDDLVRTNLEGFLNREEFLAGSDEFAADVLQILISGGEVPLGPALEWLRWAIVETRAIPALREELALSQSETARYKHAYGDTVEALAATRSTLTAIRARPEFKVGQRLRMLLKGR